MFGMTRFNPWNDLADLHRDLDAFFGRHFGSMLPEQGEGFRTFGESVFRPQAEIAKNGDKWTVSMYVPGVSPKSIDVEIDGRTLRVRGERTRENNVEPYLSEISYGRFERDFALPAEIDADHVEAAYRNGVLELTLPVKESAKPRRIEVVTSGAKQLTAA